MTRWAAALAVLALALATTSHARGIEPIDVSNSPDDSLTPVVARDGNVVAVAWIESQSTQDGLRATIYAARSIDRGQTFETPVAVAPLTGYATGLRIRASAGRVHLAWLVTNYSIGSPAAVAYARSIDAGATFEQARVVNASVFPATPALAAIGDAVAIAWTSNGAVWLVDSSTGGDTISAPSSVSSSGDVVDGSARVALGGSRLGVVWLAGPSFERALWFRAVVLDSLESSSPPLRLSTGASAPTGPDLDADGAAFAAVWSDASATVFGAVSLDGGMTFDALPSLGKASGVAMPRVAVSGSFVHRTWLGRNGRLYYRREAPNSAVPVVAHALDRRAIFPDLACEGDVVCIAWQSRSGAAARLYAAVSTDGGSVFGPAAALSRRNDFAAAPRAMAGDGVGAVAWQLPLDGREDVFFAVLQP